MTLPFVLVVDADARVEDCSRTCERWFDRPNAKLRGTSLKTLFGKGVYQAIVDQVENAIKGQESQCVETLPGDVPMRVQLRFLPRGPDGSGCIITGRRTEGQVAVEDQRARLAEIVLASDDAIIGATLDGVVTYWSPGAEELYGYTEQDVINGPIPPLSDERDMCFEAMVHRLEHEKQFRIETVGERRDGRVVEVQMTVSLIEDARGEPSGIAVIARDITARKIVEQSIARVNCRLKQQKRELEEFLRIIAHDLKHPLVGVQGLLGLIREDCYEAMPTEHRRNLDMSIAECDHLAVMIRQLSELGRLGSLRHDATRVDVGDLIRTRVEQFGPRCEARGVSIDIDAPSVEVTLPTLHVEHILDNLLDNALKHACAEGGHIGVRVEVDKTRCVLVVADDGPGIPPEKRDEVFEPFRRLEDDANRGTGIGLAAVARLAAHANGEVTVKHTYPEQQRGARFVVTIPHTDTGR